jgi:hypothetical protein
MVNKIKVVPQTKDQIEYEDAKKNFRIATAKARLHSGGIDPSKVSQQVVDKVLRIFDDMDYIQQDTQQKTSKIQQESEAKIQKLNQDANHKFGEVQKKYQELINSLNEVRADVPKVDIQTQVGTQQDEKNVTDVTAEIQTEPAKEEVREKTHEEKVSEITETLLNAFIPFMKGPISEKVNEFMCKIDQNTGNIITKGSEIDLQTNIPTEDGKTVGTEEEGKVAMTEEGKVVSTEEIKQAIYKDIL